jgi:hypothetical protein
MAEKSQQKNTKKVAAKTLKEKRADKQTKAAKQQNLTNRRNESASAQRK